jgi:hypothetical protein
MGVRLHPNGRHTDERRFHERPCIRRPRPRIAPPWIASSCQCPRLRYRHRLGRDGRATAIDVGPARGTKETEATVPRKKAPMRSTLRRYHHQPMPLRAMRQPVPVQRRLRRRTLHLPQRRLRGARPESTAPASLRTTPQASSPNSRRAVLPPIARSHGGASVRVSRPAARLAPGAIMTQERACGRCGQRTHFQGHRGFGA